MKKIILLLLLITTIAYSQEKFETYFNPLAKSSYEISASKPDKKGNFSYYIDCKSIDNSSKQAVLIIEKQKIEIFKEYLMFLNHILKKWKATALKNNVKEINKDIYFKNTFYESAFSYGDWNFSRSTTLKASFKYLSENYYIVIFSSKLQSTSNQFMKSDGYMLSFNSEEDFNSLINKLHENKVIEYYNSKSKKEDLFKN
jgi:hypothetical protein